MKDISKTLEYKGKEYKIIFNLNVMEAIQEEYDSLDKWAELTDGGKDGEPNAKAVIFGFTQMLNEGIDIENEEKGYTSPEYPSYIKPLTLKQVGRMLTAIGMEQAAQTMQDAVVESTKGEDSKNG